MRSADSAPCRSPLRQRASSSARRARAAAPPSRKSFFKRVRGSGYGACVEPARAARARRRAAALRVLVRRVRSPRSQRVEPLKVDLRRSTPPSPTGCGTRGPGRPGSAASLAGRRASHRRAAGRPTRSGGERVVEQQAALEEVEPAGDHQRRHAVAHHTREPAPWRALAPERSARTPAGRPARYRCTGRRPARRTLRTLAAPEQRADRILAERVGRRGDHRRSATSSSPRRTRRWGYRRGRRGLGRGRYPQPTGRSP